MAPRLFRSTAVLKRDSDRMKKRLIIVAFIAISMLNNYRWSFSEEGKRLRIVSLAPSTTEIIFALGLDSEIVGVSQFCDYPEAALAKERVGAFSQPNIEKIISLRPDIIFCTGLEQAPTIEKLRQLNLKVCISDPSNFKELFDSIAEIGNLVGREGQAARLITEMRESIRMISSQANSVPREKRPKVFVEIWHSPLMTAGKGSFVDELITSAGGLNIAHDMKKAFGYFSPEAVIRRNPDCIILAYMDKENAREALGRRLGWNRIAAVKSGRVYNDINSDWLLRPGPRLIDGLKEVHKRLYP